MTATAKKETISIDRERLADIEAALAGVDEHSLTRGEDARHLLAEAIQKGALNVPGGLAIMVESDDDEDGCWLRLILTTVGPGGLEYSKGWDEVMGALTGGIVGALEHAADQLNDILQLVDPREPSTRAAILRAMRSVSKGGEVPPADLHMELAARYQISDEDLEQPDKQGKPSLAPAAALLSGHPPGVAGRPIPPTTGPLSRERSHHAARIPRAARPGRHKCNDQYIWHARRYPREHEDGRAPKTH
jgi:hypothetical protein